ncbi:uncharacterized protein FFUJ_05260 [Fusarium fujikuroi IMI 58289]|uniref:Uncharacterized protein n=1 Tax=Gibberella fujikuroi (strain CBS 195.34 / IMI 58289 / NRRL A-6831) TaxID=1279085 RepID=S0DLW5_GIBF5|nr:uncharacterized protein FFUJ_05260 [Fusarium fujikuroi IMI 58289]KLP19734.1 uncharacterized protein LW94_7102 [Fusarium fujikuroi]CCT63594.1 uncharacterized protein FFUJ_05260 [Fusarium fujikuroi IMI 58289]SCN98189.1 uncharacterized protein FFM5_06737 [Fusarium fujikuroi]SCO39025.1 uncharacterized protein FFMR_05488 [Fusarium fujikuroi]
MACIDISMILAKFREYIEQETNAVFYGSNHFNFVDTTTFPALQTVQGQPEALGLAEEGMRTLKLPQDYCVNLKTLELYVHKGNAFGLAGETPSESLHKALSQVDAQLKAVPSLEEIIIRYFYDRPIPEALQLMQGLGWIVLMGDEVAP